MSLAVAIAAQTRSCARPATTAVIVAFLFHPVAAAAFAAGALEPIASCQATAWHDPRSEPVRHGCAAASAVVAGPDDIDAYAMFQTAYRVASSGLDEESQLPLPVGGTPQGIPQGTPWVMPPLGTPWVPPSLGTPFTAGTLAVDGRPCIDGHLVPEFFLLGLAKAATSSFAVELDTSPGIFPQFFIPGDEELFATFGPFALKESHLFDLDAPTGMDRYSYGKTFWEEHYPPCQAEYVFPRAAVDYTPSYLTEPQVPGRILSRYGMQSGKLKFMIMLREPVAEFQSMFYFAKQSRGFLPGTTFAGYAADLLEKGVAGYIASFLPNPSFDEKKFMFMFQDYATQIEAYFKDFDARQFLIVPMEKYINRYPNNYTLAEFVSGWLKVAPPVRYNEAPDVNSVPHPSLEEDLDPESLAKLRAMLDEYSGGSVVAAVLAKDQGINPYTGVARGSPMLFGYTGGATDVDAIAAWLDGNW